MHPFIPLLALADTVYTLLVRAAVAALLFAGGEEEDGKDQED